MSRRREMHGLTILELMVVLAVVGLMIGLSVPSISSWQVRQETRSHASAVAAALSESRALAIKEGNPYFVMFNKFNGDLTIVDDDDGDFQVDPGEFTKTVTKAPGTDPNIVLFKPATSSLSAVPVPEEDGVALPVFGISFPNDLVRDQPGVGFNTQGFPMKLPTAIGLPPDAPGTGSGTYYITDEDSVIYAVTMSPLGATRLRVFRSSIGDWF